VPQLFVLGWDIFAVQGSHGASKLLANSFHAGYAVVEENEKVKVFAPGYAILSSLLPPFLDIFHCMLNHCRDGDARFEGLRRLCRHWVLPAATPSRTIFGQHIFSSKNALACA
jgi:hypothetical protein